MARGITGARAGDEGDELSKSGQSGYRGVTARSQRRKGDVVERRGRDDRYRKTVANACSDECVAFGTSVVVYRGHEFVVLGKSSGFRRRRRRDERRRRAETRPVRAVDVSSEGTGAGCV